MAGLVQEKDAQCASNLFEMTEGEEHFSNIMFFGRGKVTRIDGRSEKQKVTVRFDSGVEKKFMTQYARFTIV